MGVAAVATAACTNLVADPVPTPPAPIRQIDGKVNVVDRAGRVYELTRTMLATDSIFGVLEGSGGQRMSLPLSNVASIKHREPDRARTVLAILGIGLLLTPTFFLRDD